MNCRLMGASVIALILIAPVSPVTAQSAPPATGAPLTLESIVDRAMADGQAVQIARSARDAARLRNSAFRARLLPQISLSGMAPSYNKSISPVIQPDGATVFVPRGEMETSMNLTLSQPIPVLGARVFVSSLLNRIEPLNGEVTPFWQSTPVVVGIEQELFRPRTMLWDSREQEIRLDVADRQFLEAREDGAARAAAAYFDLYASQLSVENARGNAAVNDSLYRISEGRYQVGKIAENDLLQSELAVLRARAAVQAAELEEERAAAALRLELNLPDDAPLAIAPPPPALAIEIDPALAVREALANRSELANLELQDLQAERRVSAAKLERRFSARLTAGFGYNQTAPLVEEVYQSPLRQQRFGLQLEVPLVQWGAGRDEEAAARADEARIALLADRSRRELSQDAHFAARRMDQARSQLQLAQKADTVATKRFEVAKNRYVIGRIGIGELYIAQTEKDAALQAYVQATRAYWLTYLNLRRVTLYDFKSGTRIN